MRECSQRATGERTFVRERSRGNVREGTFTREVREGSVRDVTFARGNVREGNVRERTFAKGDGGRERSREIFREGRPSGLPYSTEKVVAQGIYLISLDKQLGLAMFT